MSLRHVGDILRSSGPPSSKLQVFAFSSSIPDAAASRATARTKARAMPCPRKLVSTAIRSTPHQCRAEANGLPSRAWNNANAQPAGRPSTSAKHTRAFRSASRASNHEVISSN